MNRCDIGSDEKTPTYRLYGRRDNTPILEFGENILCILAKPARGAKWDPRCYPGAFVGISDSSLEAMVVTDRQRVAYQNTCSERHECKHHTAPRAHITCHTRKLSRRVHVAQDDRGIQSDCSLCVSQKSFHLTHVSPHPPCLTHSCLHVSLPALLYPSMCPSTATPRGGSCFSRMAEQSFLTGYEPKALIEVSSEHTLIILPWRKGSFDTNFLWMRLKYTTTTDVGRLTSPLSSEAQWPVFET